MDLDSPHLLRLPPEIRLRIYTFLFAVNNPILLAVQEDGTIFQPHVDELRSKPNDPVPISGQLLRTCSQVYHEAWAFMFSHNTFEILDIYTHNLGKAHFTLPTRALMTKVDFLTRGKRRLNLAAIGSCFPSLQTLNIQTHGTGAHLCVLALEYARALPCSNIRSWPTLELHINVPSSTTANDSVATFSTDWGDGNYQINDSKKDVEKIYGIFKQGRDFRLNMFEPYIMPVFKLGSEMPDLNKIILHGVMSTDHLEAIKNYESSYGDCAFEFVRQEPKSTIAGWEGKFVKKIYVWKRKDGYVPDVVRNKSAEELAALMGRWVPKLTPEFIKAMEEEGLRHDHARHQSESKDPEEVVEQTLEEL